jgi:hypothetical protein
MKNSDMHADAEKNQLWIQEHCYRLPEDQENDIYTIFIIPGDIGSEIDRIAKVFQVLTQQYNLVCFIPGNHELWRRGIRDGGSALYPEIRSENRMAENSIIKLQEILQCAEEYGVCTGPIRLVFPSIINPVEEVSSTSTRGLLLMPLHAWYHSSWDREPEIQHPIYLDVEQAIPFARKWGDYSLCSWPHSLIDQETFIKNPINNTILAEAFAHWNEEHLFTPMRIDLDQYKLHHHHHHHHQHNNNNNDSSTTNNPPAPIATAATADHEPPPPPPHHHHTSIPKTPMNTLTDCHTESSLISTIEQDEIEMITETEETLLMENITTKENEISSSMDDFTIDQVFGSPYAQEQDTIISFSHYLPRQELCPEKRLLMEPLLAKVVGSEVLECQIRRLQPHLHLFGHTHIPIDLILDQIRYIQWPLGYYRESDKQCQPIYQSGPMLVYDSMSGDGLAAIPKQLPSENVAWSKYYRTNPRTAENVMDLAPWVMARLESFSGFVYTMKKRQQEDEDVQASSLSTTATIVTGTTTANSSSSAEAHIK